MFSSETFNFCSEILGVGVVCDLKGNNQINLDLDRFVGRGQSDQTKKNAFDTAPNVKNREKRNITKSVQNACREVPHKI